MLRIDIHTDNAAFVADAGQECARIIRNLATEIEHYGLPPGQMTLFDVNGKRVGSYCEVDACKRSGD